jgi:serine/threonine-protein kinase
VNWVAKEMRRRGETNLGSTSHCLIGFDEEPRMADRIKALFLVALETPVEQRSAYLDRACGGDAEVRRRVEALLRAHEGTDDLLDHPAWRLMLERDRQETLPLAGPGTADSQPERAGRVHLQGEIARGGMGVVLRGHDPELGRELAVKVMLPAHRNNANLLRRFVGEARLAGQLQHPGIVPIHDVGQLSDGRPYFTMKLIQGRTLADLLAERPEPGHDLPRFLRYFEAVCQAVGYAHSRGVIHRDLKPLNVMVGSFGEVQVMDWGLAKRLEDDPAAGPPTNSSASATPLPAALTQVGAVVGTLGYLAPEQARGQPGDQRSDVFGLGAILCEILTGQPPFHGAALFSLLEQTRQADLGNAMDRLDRCGADAELVRLAKDCLAADSANRPADGEAVAARLAEYLAGVQERLRQAELERAQAQVKVLEQRKRQRLSLALAASLLLTVCLGGGGYAWLQQQRAERRSTTARAVDEALQQVALLRGSAAATTLGDLSGWAAAEAELKRAEDLLDQGEPDPALRRRVAGVRAEVEQGRAEAQRRADDDAAERRLVARLEAIRGEHGEHFDPRRAEQAYADAFRAFGVDLDEVEPKVAAATLVGRPGTAEIAAALDDWSLIRLVLWGRGKEAGRWQRLVEVARATDPDPWRNRLRAVLGKSRDEGAITLKKLADDGARLEQQSAMSLVLLASLLRSAGEAGRSVEVLRSAWRRFPTDYWVNNLLGVSSWSRGHFKQQEEAVRFLSAAVGIRPASAVAHSNLGAALQDQGKADEAIACYRRALALDPKFAATHNNLGILLKAQGKVEEAIECYWRAIALDPRFPRTHSCLANALQEQDKLDEAIACYRRALALDPTDVGDHNNLGTALQGQGKLDEAIACYRKAIELDRKSATAHNNLGGALAVQGKVEEAIACFHRAIALDARFAKCHYNLGNAFRARAQVNEAIECYRRFLALDPNYAPAHTNLGSALVATGKVEEAIACFHRAIALDPKLALPHFNLGIARKNQGKTDEAIVCYRRAIALDPQYAEAHCNLGAALGDQGRFAESLASFQRGHALSLKRSDWSHPSARWVREARRLADLEQKWFAFLIGQYQPTANEEQLHLALVGTTKKFYRVAANLYAAILEAEPRLAEDLKGAYRYNAACAAALAGCNQGRNAATTAQKARWRRQALTWLRAGLAQSARQLESGQAADRADVQARMRHWLGDSDLAGLRDRDLLAKLPAEERQACYKLWADVAALLKNAEETRP